MNVGIIGVVPWREAIQSTSIVSDFMQRLYGLRWAQVATVLVLWTTLASMFAVLLGYSRVPYRRCGGGPLLRRRSPALHPSRQLPELFGAVHRNSPRRLACLLTLDVVINALIVIQVLVQFMAQIIAVTLIRRNRPDIVRPYRMALYPFTSVVAFMGWFYILVASGLPYILAGTGSADFRGRRVSLLRRKAPNGRSRLCLNDGPGSEVSGHHRRRRPLH